jgi:hypothetical protein
MRSDHGLATVTAVGRYRWSDHQPGTGDSDQTGPVDDPEEVLLGSPSLAVDQILLDRCGCGLERRCRSVTRYGLLPR